MLMNDRHHSRPLLDLARLNGPNQKPTSAQAADRVRGMTKPKALMCGPGQLTVAKDLTVPGAKEPIHDNSGIRQSRRGLPLLPRHGCIVERKARRFQFRHAIPESRVSGGRGSIGETAEGL